MNNQKQVLLCFGNSIVYGAWDDEGGWVARLRKSLDRKNVHIESKLRPQVFNLGISGQTSTQLLERFESELHARYSDNANNIVIISTGANDSAFLSAENRFAVAEDQFEKNISAMIEHVRTYMNIRTILLTITPVNEHVTGTSNYKGKIRRNEFVEKYNERLISISKKYSVDLIDAYSAFKNKNHVQLLTGDGLHPNSQGYIVLFELVQKNLNK